MKFLGYQLLAIGIIWTGMAFFFNDMGNGAKIIFYVVTSWFLFLIVLFVKEIMRRREQ